MAADHQIMTKEAAPREHPGLRSQHVISARIKKIDKLNNAMTFLSKLDISSIYESVCGGYTKRFYAFARTRSNLPPYPYRLVHGRTRFGVQPRPRKERQREWARAPTLQRHFRDEDLL
jgi:hypothetical protein